jgi:hypothetical protein
MSTQIGEVNISLRMSLAQFKTDTADGAAAANKATKQIADDTSSNIGNARGSLMLLGEEIGVHIPRHLQSFITELPGVGTALNAAFASVAVLALIELIAKVVEKVQEFKQHSEDVANAMEHAGDKGRAAMQKLDDEFQKLTIQIDKLKGNDLKALQDSLAEIDRTKLENLAKQFTDLQAEAANTFEAFKVNWFQNLVGLGNNEALNNLKEGFEIVTDRVKRFQAAGDSIAAGNELQLAIIKINDALSKPIKDNTIVDQLKSELQYLNLMADAHEKITRNADASKEILQLGEQNKATQEHNALLAQEAAQLDSLDKATEAVFSKSEGKYDQEITKTQELIRQWQAYKVGWEAAHSGISTVANSQIEKLEQEVLFLKSEADSAIDMAMKAEALKNQAQIGKEAEGWADKPVYGGTKESQELYDIQTKENVAVAEAQKIYTATRTSTENYNQQVAILNSLLQQGQIDQQTYNRGLVEAKAKYDDVTIAVHQFGTDMAASIKNGQLWGKSWQTTLQSLGIDLVQLILKMTLLKTLTASMATSGGGGATGFFTTLLSGLTGKAEGGPVSGDQAYLVGEQGPELFMPKSSGSIIPNDALKSAKMGEVHNTLHVFNINGVQDFDSFKQNQSQVAAQMYAAMATAARRKG